MNIQTKKDLLAKLYVPRAKGLEGVCFNSEYMREKATPDQKAIYNAVSKAQRESGLSYDFSYVIGEKAVDILTEVEDWKNEDTLHDYIDQAVPIYTHEVMAIYTNDAWQVDEAVNEYGNDTMESEARAKLGWYMAIENMTHAIISNLTE